MLSQEAIANLPEFDNHVAVIQLSDPRVGLEGFIAIYNDRDGQPSLGATRVWAYPTLQEAARDALRLSKLMSYKSIMAGLPYGGAKAVLCEPAGGIVDRPAYFRAYAEQVNWLRGRFVTGSDIGVSADDVHSMRAVSEFIIGAGVNAAYFTAYGVVEAIKVCLERLYGSADLAGRKFAIQGVGKTGGELLALLHTQGAVLTVSDVDQDKLATVVRAFPGVQVVSPEAIYSQAVDIFSPCALGGILNSRTVPLLRCRAVVGSANNQLAESNVAHLLREREIMYAPDYVVNAGGLISVVDQYQHQTHRHDRILEKIRTIPHMMGVIMERSQIASQPSVEVAHDLAHSILRQQALVAIPT